MKMPLQTSAATTVWCRGLVVLLAAILSSWAVPAQWGRDGRAKAADDAEPSEAVQEITRIWKDQQEEIAGWRDEKQGATWTQYYRGNPHAATNLLMPKTVQAAEKVQYFLKLDSVKSDADEAKNDPHVKAIIAEAHQTVEQSLEKLNRAFNDVMAGAERSPAESHDELARIRVDDLRRSADNWFEGTPYHDANVARATKLKEKWEAMVAGAQADRDAAATRLTAEAIAAWPAIASSIKATDGFTPDKLDSFKGKIVRIKGYNRLGSDFNPGDYDYAHDINGMPVAGKFTPAVADAVDKATKQTGHDLPGADWDIFAVVEGPGQIARRTHSDGKLKVNGQEVGTVTAEGHQSVQCVVVRIFAVHAGPVAVQSAP